MDMRQRGFTLIEMIIVLALIGILLAIAVPSYIEHILRSKITEGITTLMETKVTLEQGFSDKGTYLKTVVPPNPANTDCTITTPIGTTSYSFECKATAETFVITMTGKADLDGYEYTINEKDVRATTKHPKQTSLTCWNISGSC